MQGFRTSEEVRRFHAMMEEMCHIVAVKHGGSLKGEHGTGRNVAPYVELEWGEPCLSCTGWGVFFLFSFQDMICQHMLGDTGIAGCMLSQQWLPAGLTGGMTKSRPFLQRS